MYHCGGPVRVRHPGAVDARVLDAPRRRHSHAAARVHDGHPKGERGLAHHTASLAPTGVWGKTLSGEEYTLEY